MEINVVIRAETMSDLRSQLAEALGAFGLSIGELVAPAAQPVSAVCEVAHTEAGQVIAQVEAALASESAPSETDPPKRKRRTKAEINAEAEATGGPLSPSPAADADTSNTDASTDATPTAATAVMSAAEAEATRFGSKLPPEEPAPATATWTEGGSTFTLNRDEVVDAARAFIAGHRGGKERGNAVIKGICSTLGYGRVTGSPDDRLQDFLDALGEAA